MLAITDKLKIQANLIDGEWVGADSGKTFDVNNPATGDIIGTVPDAGGAETKRAIEAAHEAFKTFRKTSAKQRSDMLHQLHDLIVENQEELVRLYRANR